VQLLACFNLDFVKLGDMISVHTGSILYEYKVKTVLVIDKSVTVNGSRVRAAESQQT
jgi:sortase (surface protein transpeptidase)